MRYDEITQMVTSSSPDDWQVLGNGPNYLDRFTQIGGAGRTWLKVDWHDYLAVYKPDVGLRLAWGMTLEDKFEFQDDRWIFANRSGYRVLTDAFWQGALVARWTVLLVDSSRCYLPDAARGVVKTGEALADYQTVTWTAKASEIALARLLDRISHGRRASLTATSRGPGSSNYRTSGAA